MPRLFAIEGIDGVGKSSLRDRATRLLSDMGIEAIRGGELRSPIKDVVKTALQKHASPLEKTLLFASDRAWTLHSIKNDLDSNRLVLWDRYVESALVYRQVELECRKDSAIDMEYVRLVNRPFPPPDWTILLDLDAEVALQRAKARGESEVYDLHFLQRAGELYRTKARTQGWEVLDATANAEAVAREAVEFIMGVLGENGTRS